MAEENAGVPPVVPQKPLCCSKFTFSFLTPLIRKIERSSLSIDDIPALPKQYSLIKLLEQFNGLQGPSRTEKATAFELAKVLFRMNKKMFVFTAGLACFYMAMQVTSPLMIKGLIESLETLWPVKMTSPGDSTRSFSAPAAAANSTAKASSARPYREGYGSVPTFAASASCTAVFTAAVVVVVTAVRMLLAIVV